MGKMKRWWIVPLLTAAWNVQALDLILQDGTTYKNVSIVNVLSNGVQIDSDPYGNGGELISTTVRYRDLTAASNFALRQLLNRRYSRFSDNGSCYLPPFSGSYAGFSGLQLPGYPHNIELESIALLENGTLGWASSVSISPQNFGRIYVYGVYMPQGGTWAGIVYPTEKQIYFRGTPYPCFALSISMAERINRAVIY